jgi:hypothetical protein
MAAQQATAADRVLAGKPGRIFNTHHYNGWFWPGHYEAPNPEYGTAIAYWLNTPASKVDVQILDAKGSLIKTLVGTGMAGINRLFWDIRGEPTEKFDSTVVYNPVFRPVPIGPPVFPGSYTAKVRIEGRGDLTVPLTVQGDARIAISSADNANRQAAIDQLYGMKKSAMAAQAAMRPITEQLAAARTRLGAQDPLHRRIAATSDSLAAVDRVVARALRSSNSLLEAISGYTGLPTSGQVRTMTWAHEDMTAAITSLNRMLQQEIPQLFAALQAGNPWPGYPTSVPLPAKGFP